MIRREFLSSFQPFNRPTLPKGGQKTFVVLDLASRAVESVTLE
jgi:hypothetical protein